MSDHEEQKSKKQREEEREAPSHSDRSLAPEPSPTSEELMPSDTSRTESMTGKEALEVVRRSQEAALEGLRTAAPALAPTPLSAVVASEADITDELEKGGPAFGAFVKSVGLAVAEAQSKLDETLVATAKALSDTKIDVIAIFEQEIDDNGQMTAGNANVQKLPLINYLMPTAYQWTRVYMEADMKVSEFNSANGFNIKGQSTSFTAGVQGSAGLFGASVSGDMRFSTGSFQYGVESSTAQDSAAGSLHLEATLEPRPDIQLPRPLILQKGPRLKITAGAREDITDTATPPAVTGRKITLTAELRDKAKWFSMNWDRVLPSA